MLSCQPCGAPNPPRHGRLSGRHRRWWARILQPTENRHGTHKVVKVLSHLDEAALVESGQSLLWTQGSEPTDAVANQGAASARDRITTETGYVERADGLECQVLKRLAAIQLIASQREGIDPRQDGPLQQGRAGKKRRLELEVSSGHHKIRDERNLWKCTQCGSERGLQHDWLQLMCVGNVVSRAVRFGDEPTRVRALDAAWVQIGLQTIHHM